MKNQILGITVLLALISVFAFAQTDTPPTPPTPAQMAANIVARLTKILDLTSAQQTQATTIFTTEETTLATVRTSMRTARTALQTAIKADDTAAIATQSAAIGTLTAQEVQAQSTAAAAFYAILTADQQSKYDTLGPLGAGGPGGPGGPGGFGPRGVGTH
jgi:Spy/CpxP family protein refolding chaperone